MKDQLLSKTTHMHMKKKDSYDVQYIVLQSDVFVEVVKMFSITMS